MIKFSTMLFRILRKLYCRQWAISLKLVVFMSLLKMLDSVSIDTRCITFYLKVHLYNFEKNNQMIQLN